MKEAPSHSIQISEKVTQAIEKEDAKLNALRGYDSNDLQFNLSKLLTFKRVEVGWRASCGKTDITQKTYRAWCKIIKLLVKEGVLIKEEGVKHGNSYATLSGGFWQSTIYCII